MYAHALIFQCLTKAQAFQWKFGNFEARALAKKYVNLTLFTGAQDRRRAAGMWVDSDAGQGHQDKQENTAARSPFSCT
jgi:hypothetical protein